MGINTSGVRQISEAVGSGDAQRIARIVTTLRRVAFSGAIRALLLVLLCRPVSRLVFEDDHAGAVALLALAVSRGLRRTACKVRRIADLALANVWGSFYGPFSGILVVYYYRERAIAPSRWWSPRWR